MSAALPEPWLRGPIENVHPLVMPLFFSFTQVREDLRTHVSGLSEEQLWRTVGTAGSVGFQMKHMAGSVDRLSTYLAGGALNDAQMQFLRTEHERDATWDELLNLVDQHLAKAERVLLDLTPEQMYDARTVGRKALPTTVIGLLVHLAEHTQRHLGQAITTAKFVRAEDRL